MKKRLHRWVLIHWMNTCPECGKKVDPRGGGNSGFFKFWWCACGFVSS